MERFTLLIKKSMPVCIGCLMQVNWEHWEQRKAWIFSSHEECPCSLSWVFSSLTWSMVWMLEVLEAAAESGTRCTFSLHRQSLLGKSSW